MKCSLALPHTPPPTTTTTSSPHAHKNNFSIGFFPFSFRIDRFPRNLSQSISNKPLFSSLISTERSPRWTVQILIIYIFLSLGKPNETRPYTTQTWPLCMWLIYTTQILTEVGGRENGSV